MDRGVGPATALEPVAASTLPAAATVLMEVTQELPPIASGNRNVHCRLNTVLHCDAPKRHDNGTEGRRMPVAHSGDRRGAVAQFDAVQSFQVAIVSLVYLVASTVTVLAHSLLGFPWLAAVIIVPSSMPSFGGFRSQAAAMVPSLSA